MTETAIMQAALAALSALPGCMAFRNNTGVGVTRAGTILRAGLPGSADILGVYRGRAIAVEIKTTTGRQSLQQKRFQQAWEGAGGVYVLARSADEAVAGVTR